MKHDEPELIAVEAKIDGETVWLRLLDGSTHSFPIAYYPRLQSAPAGDLGAVKLRVGGRALRWENLDEDIWIADAILGRYPAPPVACVNEPPTKSPNQL